MMNDALTWIKILNLKPHPEGGYYRRTYTSNVKLTRIDQNKIAKASASAIYYLLESDDKSGFHRLKSDELWFYHVGAPVDIYILSYDGKLVVQKLGIDFEKGESLQVMIQAGCWFAAKVNIPGSFTIISCVVTPEFTFDEFELGLKDQMIKEFPIHTEVFNHLCR